MHRPVLDNPSVTFVAPFLLGMLVQKRLSERSAGARIMEEDRNSGTPTPSIGNDDELFLKWNPGTPVPSIRKDYGVFLSFRGPDTRNGFTSHLCHSLAKAGIRVSQSDIEIPMGARVDRYISESIENSKILIPIISENYASSKWCLRELAHMMECRNKLGHLVLPIFYKVEPADVRYQKGHFGEAFDIHRRRSVDMAAVDKWKQALWEVTELQGFEVANRSEAEMVELVVQQVLKELNKAVELVVSDNLIGIDIHVEGVMEMVNQNSSAILCVGIYGIEGIGKTTLAKVIYNKLSDLFEYRSFIADLRESYTNNNITLLYQLIFDMEKKKIQFSNSNEAIKYISSRFKDKKVLIILDDVDTTNQLEALAGYRDWFGPGSRIFVTTRNESVLDEAEVDIKYEHKQMDEKQSLILFSRHAFGRDYPPGDFFNLARRVVSIMEGLPLAIEVVGSFLCGKPPPVWEKTIQKMQNMPHMEVQEKVRIIDEELGEDQTNVENVPSKNGYEVFLNFRGVDTRSNFVDHLYYNLVNAGICVFKDDDELRVGERVSGAIAKAIRNSRILIPIISVNYGSSKWCLDELVQMMKSKKCTSQVVLPIFYEVEPGDVKYQRGSFGRAFLLLGKRFNEESTKEWKEALRDVSDIHGWQSANRRAGELVKSVVQTVLTELKKAVELYVPKNLVGNLVGIDSHVEKVMELIDESYGATVSVGINGMGGVGKTTLVKIIYDRLSNLFAHRSFIADIRETCQPHGIVYLQNRLISDILGKNIPVYNEDEGINFIKSRIRNKKVLIILDDVDTADQIKALAGDISWFAPGSRIFVTTRNEKALDRAGVDVKYKLKPMDKEQSLILFSRHAFRRDSPPSDFLAMSRLVGDITGGLPLALEVLGSFLSGKPANLWRETLEKMQNVSIGSVQEMLMISYHALQIYQKEMFLDIACFLIGSDVRIACYMWDACDFFSMEGIEVLRSLSLIKIGDNHELMMCAQLRDLGREIVREENRCEPHRRSRLWDYEEALEVLVREKGTENIEAIYLEKGNSTRIADAKDEGSRRFTNQHFKNLSSLRFLHMSEVNLIGDFKDTFCELRWLKWGNCSPTFEAINFHPKELVILDLSGSLISECWLGWSSMKMAEKLKVLNLTGCHNLKNTSYLSAFKRLEILILRDCSQLEQIDPRIGDVETLVSLDLSGCLHLEELPPQVGKLENLKELLLDQTMLREIPSSFGYLKMLETLTARDCESLLKLPHSIGHLENLSTLVLSGCIKLEALPESIESLKNLEILNTSNTAIKELPSGVSKLKKLKI